LISGVQTPLVRERIETSERNIHDIQKVMIEQGKSGHTSPHGHSFSGKPLETPIHVNPYEETDPITEQESPVSAVKNF
jgi:hypothetical protein